MHFCSRGGPSACCFVVFLAENSFLGCISCCGGFFFLALDYSDADKKNIITILNVGFNGKGDRRQPIKIQDEKGTTWYMATATNHELKTYKTRIKRQKGKGMVKDKDAATDAEIIVYGEAFGWGGEKRTAKQQKQARTTKARKKKPPQKGITPRDEFSDKKTTKQQADDYNAASAAAKQARGKRVKKAQKRRVASGKSANTNQIKRDRAKQERDIIRMLEEDDL